MAKKYLTSDPAKEIDAAITALDADKVVIVTDTNVKKLVLPKLSRSEVVSESPVISIFPGEDGKNLESVTSIWNTLEECGATRRSVVLNIGGGVVTDLGGFAAATFKRGLRTVNFPTTVLGAVDAATGGKTGINYNGLKNEIGAFHLPSKVIISILPFSSQSHEEILSGYAEMIKTALISDKEFYVRSYNIEDTLSDSVSFGESVEKCVSIKDDIVAQDPTEKGLRKILNFGHTAGHAFESLRFETGSPVTHGKAVAHGMLVALILSHKMLGFDTKEVICFTSLLKSHYGNALIKCDEIAGVIEKMNSDKKNRKYGEPAFTLLKDIGIPEINCIPSQKDISEALDFYIDVMG